MFIRKIGVCILLVALLCGCAGKADHTAELATQETRPNKKEAIETMLVFCIDADANSQDTGDYRNGNRAELLLLMVMDQEQKTTRVLQLNPDTVVPFTPPGSQETLQVPLGEVYSYGSGGSDSGFAQLKAVSKFLGGITMDHYLMFTMDAVGIVNDAIGGVSMDTAHSGAEMMDAQAALEYLRFREDGDVDNARYMQRQRDYMMGLLPDLFQKAQDDDFLTKLTLQIGEGMATDLTLSQMAMMLEQLDAYDLDETVLTLTGRGEMQDGQRRFYVEADAVTKIADGLFY